MPNPPNSPTLSLVKQTPKLLLLLPLALTACRHPEFPGYPANFRQFAYVANAGGNTVTILDLVYLRPDRTLRVGENPIAIALNPQKPEAYVLNRQSESSSGSLSVIDTDKNEVATTLPLRKDPSSISLDRSGRTAYIANAGSSSVTILNLETRQSTALATPSDPTSALISPDSRTLVITLPESNTVALFSVPEAGPPTLRSTYMNCPGATSPVILPDSSKAFIACSKSNQVLALSLAADPKTWAAKQNGSLLADHPVALLDVGHNPTHLTLKPDGGEIFVSNSSAGSISELSTTTNEVGSTFGIGDEPESGIVSADNSALWIANAGADSLSLYSISDGKRLPSLHVGASPDILAFSTDKEQRLLLAADRKSGDIAVIRTNLPIPTLFTILPAGANPSAIAIRSNIAIP